MKKDYWFSSAGIRFEKSAEDKWRIVREILNKIFWGFVLVGALYFIGHLIIALCFA